MAATTENFELTGAQRKVPMASADDSNTRDLHVVVPESSVRTLRAPPAEDLRFAVGDEVIAFANGEGWVHGRITQQYYHDPTFSDPNHRVPYRE